MQALQTTLLPYLNPDLPLAERVTDLISRLTLEEKIGLMRSQAEGIERLGIPAYNYWSEGLHGVGRNGRATVFPQAIGMAATWNPKLIHRVATAISTEGRAKYHEALRKYGNTLIYQGLTFWSPNVNIFRDPRWGRGQETWGEDPLLTGEMGAAFVRGMQGDDPTYLRTAACAKHYAVHSGPEKGRHSFDVAVSRRELFDTYLPAFQKLVMEAKVESVMGAYNRLYGVPCNGSTLLLEDILRKRWGFEGHVVSDCVALTDFHRGHHYTQDAVETAAVALKAGCDLSCVCTYDHLGESIERGLIEEADIDRALARTLGTRFKLGMFDPPERVPYASISMEVVDCEEHRQLAYEAALQSIVLLKNKKQILPLGPDVRTVMVVGPNATSLESLLGNYAGISGRLVTALEGFIQQAPEGVKIEYRPSCTLVQAFSHPDDYALSEAAAADVTIACMGLSPLLEGEEGDALLSTQRGDRETIELPAVQVQYLKKLAVSGARVVLVLFSGSAVALGELEEMVDGVVQVWYPGEEGGRALADVLYGKVSPSGKLPVTYPRSTAQLPPFDDYSMDQRTYRYSTQTPLFPFGFGLSYTQFEYQNLAISQERVAAGQPLEVRFELRNAGSLAAAEVAQIYLTDVAASVKVPLYKLVGFQRLELQPGQSQEVHFTLTPAMMSLVDEEGELCLEAGEFCLHVGGCSPDPRGQQLGAPQGLSIQFTVE